jgi:hypothetical protein
MTANHDRFRLVLTGIGSLNLTATPVVTAPTLIEAT